MFNPTSTTLCFHISVLVLYFIHVLIFIDNLTVGNDALSIARFKTYMHIYLFSYERYWSLEVFSRN